MLGRFCKAAHLPDRMAHNALRSLRMVLGLLGGFPEAWMRLHAPAHGLTSLQDMRAWQARPPRRSSRLFRRHRCNPAAEPKPAPANLSRTGSTCEPENRRTESGCPVYLGAGPAVHKHPQNNETALVVLCSM